MLKSIHEMKNIYIKIAGFINIITALIHLIGGQMDLINPLMKSDLAMQVRGEMLGVWHIVTIVLFYTSFLILKEGYKPSNSSGHLKPIGIFYILSGIPFIIITMLYPIFAPQWILLIPIGIFILIGLSSKSNSV